MHWFFWIIITVYCLFYIIYREFLFSNVVAVECPDGTVEHHYLKKQIIILFCYYDYTLLFAVECPEGTEEYVFDGNHMSNFLMASQNSDIDVDAALYPALRYARRVFFSVLVLR